MALLLLPAAVSAQSSETSWGDDGFRGWALKTNLLYDATATVNLGVEFRTGGHTSIDFPVSYNPWKFSNEMQWRHILVQPELRWWPRKTFHGSFWGLHAAYAYYNVGGLPNSPFSEYMKLHRFEGSLAAVGISYGYRWNFSQHWAMEATIGAGYSHLSYGKYPCARCGEKIGDETKNYFGPTKAGISLVYAFGGYAEYGPNGKNGRRGKKNKSDSGNTTGFLPFVALAKSSKSAEPRLVATYITPEVETLKKRSETGKAYLDFVVNRWEILPNFKNNASELQRIDDMAQRVNNDPDATITGISITGYASIEGSYASNLTLSENRAEAVKEHIQQLYNFRADLFTVKGMGEDWTTLDSLVNASSMQERSRILQIIRGTGIFDGREKKLMDLAGGTPYLKMMDTFFPQLRRVEYRFNYTVLPFTLEKGKEVFRTKPSNLSLNEMFTIANTYEPGSSDFNEVFETAAQFFPQNNVANLNAAASALDRKDTAAAARYLDRVLLQNNAYWNNLGILSWLQGDREKAASCFAKGGAQGAGNLNEIARFK